MEIKIQKDMNDFAHKYRTLQEEAIKMSGLLLETIEDRLASSNSCRSSSESCITDRPSEENLNNPSPSQQCGNESRREAEATELGEVCERNCAPFGTTKQEYAVALVDDVDGATILPETSRYVASTFNPLAGLDPVVGYPKVDSRAPSQRDRWSQGQVALLTASSESGRDGIVDYDMQESKTCDQDVQGNRQYSTQLGLVRGRRLLGWPEPREFPELFHSLVHDSPRRKRYTRDVLSPSGSASHTFRPLAPPGSLQSWKEESSTDCDSRDNSASAPSSAKAGTAPSSPKATYAVALAETCGNPGGVTLS